MNELIQNKLAGVVILYNPDSRTTFDNILTYSSSLSKLYILDNSEILSNDWESLAKKIGDHVEYIFYSKNEGISKRLNFAVEKATKEGYDYLLTMDQDSSFNVGLFDEYINSINSCKIHNAGQYGVNFQPQFTNQNILPQEVDFLITSGSIIVLKHFNHLGKFNEKLFIDFVDIDFSFRVKNAGLKNLQFTNIFLKHQIGELVMGRSLKTFKKTKRIIHTPIRIYYIIRNGLFLIFKTRDLNKRQKIEVLIRMKILKNNYLYHPHLFKAYFYTFIGVFDFLRNKTGKK